MPPPPKHTQSSKIIHHKTKGTPTNSVPDRGTEIGKITCHVFEGMSVLFGHLFKYSFIHSPIIYLLLIHSYIYIYLFTQRRTTKHRSTSFLYDGHTNSPKQYANIIVQAMA